MPPQAVSVPWVRPTMATLPYGRIRKVFVDRGRLNAMLPGVIVEDSGTELRMYARHLRFIAHKAGDVTDFDGVHITTDAELELTL